MSIKIFNCAVNFKHYRRVHMTVLGLWSALLLVQQYVKARVMKCKDSRDGRRHHQEINVAAKTLEIKLEEMLPLKIAYRYFFLWIPNSAAGI